jgi:cyclopropane-fatty-acyl-phospholipid synthase
MFVPPSELALGEAYLRDDFDVEGSLEAATMLQESIAGVLKSPLLLGRILSLLLSLPTDDLHPERVKGGVKGLSGRIHSRGRDAVAVRHHYDTGNGFYSLWLGHRMVYSCAYFETGAESINQAQEAKLDMICRKLRLQPSETLLDIGCGWGALVKFAAEHYDVRATGITLSAPQAEIARESVRAAGLQDRVTIEVLDYRDMPRRVEFDKVVSVGMFEHVGRVRLPAYFREAFRLTKPGGLFLNHGIALGPLHNRGVPAVLESLLWKEGAFVQKYVFPDGELMLPGEAIDIAEGAGFETRDVENLREHYTLTLRHWVRGLEEHHDEAVSLVGEETYRVWRLYMSGSAYAFDSGNISVVQALFSRPDGHGKAHLPLTRKSMYESGPTLVARSNPQT